MCNRGWTMRIWMFGLALLLLTAACTASRPPTPTPPPASEGGAAKTAPPPTPTPEPSPTATLEPSPTPTRTETPEPTPTPTPDAMALWRPFFEQHTTLTEEEMRALVEEYALPIATLDIDPGNRTAEEIAQEILNMEPGEYVAFQSRVSVPRYQQFISQWMMTNLEPNLRSVGGIQRWSEMLADKSELDEENWQYVRAVQDSLFDMYLNATTADFQPQYMAKPEGVRKALEQAGILPATEQMLALIQQVSQRPTTTAVIRYYTDVPGAPSELRQEYIQWRASPLFMVEGKELQFIGGYIQGILTPPMQVTDIDTKVQQAGIEIGFLDGTFDGNTFSTRYGDIYKIVDIQTDTGYRGKLWFHQEGKGGFRTLYKPVGGQVLDAKGNVLFEFGEFPEPYQETDTQEGAVLDPFAHTGARIARDYIEMMQREGYPYAGLYAYRADRERFMHEIREEVA